MAGHHRMKGELKLKYEATLLNNGQFDIIEQYTEVPVLCCIQDTLGTTDHCITVLRNWIFDSNFPRAFPKTIKWLHFVCARRTNNDAETSKAQYRCVYEAVQVSPLINT
eukprot:scaffold152542_cov30-Attheya_sp.AAC.2